MISNNQMMVHINVLLAIKVEMLHPIYIAKTTLYGKRILKAFIYIPYSAKL